MAIGIGIFALAWTLARPSEAQAPARAEVTLGDANGTLVGAADVYVDGVLECDSTPCSISASPGPHQVELRLANGMQRLRRGVSLDQAQSTAIHFALPSAAAAPAPVVPVDQPISVDTLPVEASQDPLPSAPAAFQAVSSGTPSKPSVPVLPVARGFLNLNSIPIAKVVLDGRPLGTTPLIGVDVPAGAHSVTFVHPELGRRSASVNVDAGQHKAVVVRFPPPTSLDE